MLQIKCHSTILLLPTEENHTKNTNWSLSQRTQSAAQELPQFEFEAQLLWRMLL